MKVFNYDKKFEGIEILKIMKKVLMLMLVAVFTVISCSEKSKNTDLCEKGDKLACNWFDKIIYV